MKTLFLIAFATGLSFTAFSQTAPSQNIPPMKMLPGVGKVGYFFELPEETDYKIFDQKGKLIKSGKAKWIDYTKFAEGTYFIKFDGKTESFTKKSE